MTAQEKASRIFVRSGSGGGRHAVAVGMKGSDEPYAYAMILAFPR